MNERHLQEREQHEQHREQREQHREQHEQHPEQIHYHYHYHFHSDPPVHNMNHHMGQPVRHQGHYHTY